MLGAVAPAGAPMTAGSGFCLCRIGTFGKVIEPNLLVVFFVEFIPDYHT